ncbi:hypothetical protein [Rhodococcoides navarretei]|uniref:Uncharacterized protein n=1 Tax=Rhodococcus navarretei TaxID=3128981 RepID=A0ABU9CPQ0_9NOCA
MADPAGTPVVAAAAGRAVGGSAAARAPDRAAADEVVADRAAAAGVDLRRDRVAALDPVGEPGPADGVDSASIGPVVACAGLARRAVRSDRRRSRVDCNRRRGNNGLPR